MNNLKANSENHPRALVDRMNKEKEHSTLGNWFKSHWEDTKEPASQITVLTEPPLPAPFYNKEDSKFLLKIEDSALKAAVERYLVEDPECRFWQQFDPTSCSWRHVFEELERAKGLYQEKARNNPLRRAFRHGAGITRNIEPLLSVIPQENGVGLLQGAFKIIFHAVKRRSDTCEQIFTALENVPETLLDAEHSRQTHPHNESLLDCYSSLHYELARCIPRLIDILLRRENDSSIKKHYKSVFSDGLAEVDAVLKPMKKAEEKLRQCQRHLVQNGVAEACKQSRLANDKLDAVTDKVTEIHLSQGYVSSVIVNDLSPALVRFAIDMKQHRMLNMRNAKVIEDAARVMNSLLVMVHEELRGDDCSGTRRQAEAPRQANGTKLISQTRLRISTHVPVAICTSQERDEYSQSLYSVRRAYHDFDDKALARAGYLITIPRFISWLAEPQSDLLLVDGHCAEQSVGRISPLSLICAGLAQTLSKGGVMGHGELSHLLPERPPIVLSFFCGQHSSYDDDNHLVGPWAMIRCLVDQLLTLWPPDLPAPDVSSSTTAIRHPNQWGQDVFRDASTSFYCQLFSHLLGQLGPYNLVYCIIDGISFFDTQLWGWEQYLNEIIDCFLDIVYKQREDGMSRNKYEEGAVTGGTPTRFKVLLVSPEESTDIGCGEGNLIIPDECRVDLIAGNLGSSEQVWEFVGDEEESQ